MLIGIDGNEANVKYRVGVGEFSFELLEQFYKIQNSKFKIYLKNVPIDDLPKKEARWEYRVIGPRILWTQLALPFDLYTHRPRPDVFFTPTHYAPRFSLVPTVVSVMDLSYVFFPELFKKRDLYKLNSWTMYSVKNASKVITISQSSKNDIIKYYQVSEEKVEVIYPGIKSKVSNNNPKLLKEKYGIEGDYILFVGTLQPRKNIVRLVEAFSRLIQDPAFQRDALVAHENFLTRNARNDEHSNKRLVASARSENFVRSQSNIVSAYTTLVVVGKKGWMYDEILQAPKKFEVENKVKFLDYVSEKDLPTFYENARCFVFPSLYEGFGLPVLEAMKYGCPVVASNVSSIPEAGGNAAIYFDPKNIDDISDNIKKVIEDKNLAQSMRKKGFEQVKKFSWKKAAEETLKVLEEVAHER